MPTLRPGDPAYFATYLRSVPTAGLVKKISPTGQITVEYTTPMGQNRTCRFNPRNGHEIGGLSRLISGEEFDKHTQAFQQRVVKQELRVRLNALERSKLEDKQAVLQALREMIAHVEVTFS